MEGPFFECGAAESEMNGNKAKKRNWNFERIVAYAIDSRGMALVTTILLSLAGLAVATALIYFITQSVAMSGAGKRYATASEAADGAVEVMKDSINLVLMGEPVTTLPLSDPDNCLATGITQTEQSCTASLTLPGANLFAGWRANVTVTRLYSSAIPGSRIEFARAGGAPATAAYFRINTVVTGPGNARAETSALYRFAG